MLNRVTLSLLRPGTRHEPVVLSEVPAGRSGPILRAFTVKIRGGRSFLTVSRGATDAEYALAAALHPVFEVRPA